MVKVGINGFGRIGRLAYRAIRARYDSWIAVVAVNDVGDLKMMTHLLKYDSTYGRFPGEIEPGELGFLANGKEVRVLAGEDPANLPWLKLGVELVIEATGLFTQVEKAKAHLTAGARRSPNP